MFERPRLSRSRPLTPRQRTVLRHLARGARIVDDIELSLEPLGPAVARVTLRALVRAGLVHDPIPLLDPDAGTPTKHGWAWIRRELLGDDE